MKGFYRRVANSVALVCAAYFVVWACAPPSTLPPPVPLAAEGRQESGGAIVGGPGAARYRNSMLCCRDFEVDAMVWGHQTLANGLLLGGTWFGGTTSGLGSGGYVRKTFNDNPDLLFGGQLSGGWLWASVGLPLSGRLFGDVWLYTHPTVGYRMTGPLLLPLGFSVPAGKGRISTEASVTPAAGMLFGLGYYEAPLLQVSLGYGRSY